MAREKLTLGRLTLRYAIVASLFLALSGIEGMMMRTRLLNIPFIDELHYYAVMTVHPLVGTYGWAYMAVMGAFFYLVPTMLKRPLFSLRLAAANMWLHIAGVLTIWLSGFLFYYAPLYTIYWPLPVYFSSPGAIVFSVGLIVTEISVLLFLFNIFATILGRFRPDLTAKAALVSLFVASFGLGGIARAFRGAYRRVAVSLGLKAPRPTLPDGGQEQKLPVFVTAVFRGSIDAVINAVVLAGAGALIASFTLYRAFAGELDPLVIDPLVYKNIYWWGLDMIADGDVLIWTAGTLYLLAPLLAGRKLYGEEFVRYVILADLIISMGVWSHHLLSDRPQPAILRLVSGQFITWGEGFTMGLTFFATLMTLWLARPIKLSLPVKFMLGGIVGFLLGGMAGLLQANYALNTVVHNTQWVPGFHVHQMLLTGLSNILFAAIYALTPMLTGTELKSETLGNLHFWLWTIGGIGMSFSMGLAWSDGMLRRTLYFTDAYLPYMASAAFFGALLALGFLAFLLNVIRTFGLRTIIGLFMPAEVEG